MSTFISHTIASVLLVPIASEVGKNLPISRPRYDRHLNSHKNDIKVEHFHQFAHIRDWFGVFDWNGNACVRLSQSNSVSCIFCSFALGHNRKLCAAPPKKTTSVSCISATLTSSSVVCLLVSSRLWYETNSALYSLPLMETSHHRLCLQWDIY